MSKHFRRIFNGIGTIGFVFWLIGTLSVCSLFLLSLLRINLLGGLVSGFALFGVIGFSILIYLIGWVLEQLKFR